MYLVDVTLRWLKYLRYAPEVENVRYAPDTPTLNIIIFNVCTLDILYIHYSFPFAITTTKAQLERKQDA